MHLAENASAYRPKFTEAQPRQPQFSSSNSYIEHVPATTRHESMDSVEIITTSNNRNQNTEQDIKQQNGIGAENQNAASCNKSLKLNHPGVKEEQHTLYTPNGVLHNWPTTSTNLSTLTGQSFFDGTTLHSLPHTMTVNPSAFDFQLWGGNHLSQHPATGQFYHHHFSNPYHIINHQRGVGTQEGLHQMHQQQQQLPQISPTNQSPNQPHQTQQQQLSPVLPYSIPAQSNISPRGGEGVNMNNSVPQPAPSSSSHSSESVNSPPPSFAVFQSLFDQQQFFQQQNYPQDHSFGSLNTNAFDGYNRIATYAQSEQQFPYSYNQSYYQNNTLLPSPNTSSSNLVENTQVVGNNANSPVLGAATTTLHMPTPPGESSDNTLCKLETVSPGNGNTTLIPLTKVRDYHNVKETQRQTTPQNGTNVVGTSGAPINASFISQHGQVLQFSGMESKDMQNCSLTFNLPITPPPNVAISNPLKKCQCQVACNCVSKI